VTFLAASLTQSQPDWQIAPPGATVDYDKDAFVCLGSTLTAEPGKLTEENKADVLNSELLAQLAASKKYDRQTQAMLWYGAYREVLENIGWVIQTYGFKTFTMGKASFTADEVVLAVLKSVVTDEVLGLLAATFQALKGLGQDSDQVKMFDSSSSGSNNGNFQAYPCYVDPTYGVGLTFSGYQLTTTESITRFLWFTFKSSTTTISAAAETVALNEQVYALVRAAVLKKLGKAANDFVDGLDI
jgi:hypothetical protein